MKDGIRAGTIAGYKLAIKYFKKIKEERKKQRATDLSQLQHGL